MKKNGVSQQINQTITNALLELQQLVIENPKENLDVIGITKTFLVGVMTTAIDLTQLKEPGSAPFLYADIEAAAKLGGLRAIRDVQSTERHYSVSNIDSNDMVTAMNYMGQELGTSLFKALHELPLPLRTTEMMLRAIEALLSNLLSQKFSNPHDILDSLCEHVHLCLKDLKTRQH